MKKTVFFGMLLAGLVCLIAGCMEGDKFDYNKQVILVTGTEESPMAAFVVDDTTAAYTVTASATAKVTENITVNFAIDTTLVAAYNQANKSSFFPIPLSAIRMEGTSGVIEAGKASSSGVTIRIVSLTEFVEGRTYLIPVTITGVQGGNMEVLEPSRTLFLRIYQTVDFHSLNIENYNVNSNFIFDDDKKVTMDKGYTYEIKCYIRAYHPGTGGNGISRLCQFTSKDETGSSMLRFGEDGNTVDALQWVNPGANLFSTMKFETGKWYLISLVYNLQSVAMYVNGVKDSEMPATEHTSSFQRFEIGMSWASTYRQRQRFLGRIAEGRVWNRPLSVNEIQTGICGVDPNSSGLIAYWKFNEGSGHIFHDATGHGYDMDWSNTWRSPGEGDIEQINLSSYVSWIKDGQNLCNPLNR
ncbi:MAG: DUF1735 and LamG domain-containing protein [Prevotellaceae bacterium]|jgi:hypothetical protein|nr:DUF1735 and LamG domain-containing protein [Prevotellaceae bacterium]